MQISPVLLLLLLLLLLPVGWLAGSLRRLSEEQTFNADGCSLKSFPN